MSSSFPNPNLTVTPVSSNYINTAPGAFSYGVFRLPSDPLYRADVVIENIVVGSAYILGYTPAGGEFTPLGFSGIVPGTPGTKTTITLSNVPSYASPMLLELRVRKSSATPKYKPLVQYANHGPNGTNMYLAQQLDNIAA